MSAPVFPSIDDIYCTIPCLLPTIVIAYSFVSIKTKGKENKMTVIYSGHGKKTQSRDTNYKSAILIKGSTLKRGDHINAF